MTTNEPLNQLINSLKLDKQIKENDIVIENTSLIDKSTKDLLIINNVVIEKTKKSNRCNFDNCKKKLGIMPFECRCCLIFCAEHRLPENHKCNFDYKTNGKLQIEKNNQKVIGEKIQKI